MAQEKNFENRIKKFLDSQGVYYIKYWGGGMFTRAGVPDLLCCVNGHFVAVEVKAETGKPSELQLYNIDKIKQAGGIALILYQHDFDMFKNLIMDLLK